MTSPISAGAAPTPSPRPRRRVAALMGAGPAVVAAGAIVVVIAVGALAFVGLRGGSTAATAPATKPAATASATRAASVAGVVFSPPTVSCASPADFTTTTRLPATAKAGSTVTERFDGATIESIIMEPAATLARLADGSWLDTVESSAARMAEVCANGGKNDEGVGVLVPGVHTVSFVDASGAVLAQGSYTVAAPASLASASPAPTTGATPSKASAKPSK